MVFEKDISVVAHFTSGGTFYKTLYRMLVHYEGALTDFINAVGIPSIFYMVNTHGDQDGNIKRIDEMSFVTIMRSVAWLLWSNMMPSDLDVEAEKTRILNPIAEAHPTREVRAIMQCISRSSEMKQKIRVIDFQTDNPFPDDDRLLNNYVPTLAYMNSKDDGEEGYIYGFFSKKGDFVIPETADTTKADGFIDVTRTLHLTFSIDILKVRVLDFYYSLGLDFDYNSLRDST